jgi:hypothetical protein
LALAVNACYFCIYRKKISLFWKKHQKLIQEKRKLLPENAKGCFAELFFKQIGYPGFKQANFYPILNKYYAVLNEESMKRFVYLQIQSEKDVAVV